MLQEKINMENGFFEELAIKKLKNNQNKTKITLCINNFLDLYNRFSITNNGNIIDAGKISTEIMDYIKMETENIPKENSLIISIKTNENGNGKVKLIDNLIKRNIKEKIGKVNENIRRTNRNSFILAFIGMILIGITQIFQIFERRYSVNEFIIVMSWVFMWKAVETFFFERVKLIKEKAILLKIYFSEIIIEK
jgi:hypothetical protein